MTNADPSIVIDLIDAFRRSKAMFTAVALGLFDRLAEGPNELHALAGLTGTNPDALERLLDACVAMQLLSKQDGLYGNLPVADTYLRRSSPNTLSGYILYSNRALYPLWGHLEDAVRDGRNRWDQTFGRRGALFDHFFETEEAKRDFVAGMHGFGLLSSPLVAQAFDLSRFRRVVDLGGATGHLTVELCKKWPGLRGVVFDLPAVADIARDYIGRSPVADHIEVIAGNFFEDPLPEADLFSAGRILHDWSEANIHRLLSKVYNRLPRGGAFLIAERLLNDDKTGPLGSLLQSLNMLVCTEGKERTLAEYELMLREVGFAEVHGHKTGGGVDAVLAVKR
jgi:acetylserotonin N-methyltransferase